MFESMNMRLSGTVLRALVIVLVLPVVLSAFGCSITRPRTVTKTDYVPEKNERIIGVDLVDGGRVDFNQDGGIYVTAERIIRGMSTAGEEVEIPIDQVALVHVNRQSTGLSLAATFAGLAGLSMALMYLLAMHAQWIAN
jgi:hypothetical protein